MKVLIEMEVAGLPPTVNSMYRSMRDWRRYKTMKCRDYQAQVVKQMREQYRGEPSTSRFELRIGFSVKDNRRWDIDNRVKAIQDCLSEAQVIADDKQIDILHVERQHSEREAMYLRLKELQQVKPYH